MATSDISGDFGGGSLLTCILDEGNPTVSDNIIDQSGAKVTGLTWASALKKNEWVALSVETSNTYAACNGMFVVEAVSNGDDFVVGRIVSTPQIEVMPATSGVADSLTKRLAARYYRVATVEIMVCTSIMEVTLKTADAVAVTPGGVSLLDVDVSESAGEEGLTVNDIAGAAGSASWFSFHYQAKVAGATVTILLGVKGFGTAAT